jgi:peptide/nickel transport system permease protein
VRLGLDDERRVKSLSPSALVVRRFMRNRLAIVGSVIIIAMFLFAFLGGIVTPYGEAQLFTKDTPVVRDFAHATYSGDISVISAEGKPLSATVRGALVAAIKKGENLTSSGGVSYGIASVGENSWVIGELQVFATGRKIGNSCRFTPVEGARADGALLEEAEKAVLAGESEFEFNGELYMALLNGKNYELSAANESGLASRLLAQPIEPGFKADYLTLLAMENAIADGKTSFQTAGGEQADVYDIRENNGSYIISQGGADKFLASSLVVQAVQTDIIISIPFRDAIESAMQSGAKSFYFEGKDYVLQAENGNYQIKTEQITHVVSMYERPSAAHWLGTDGNGMDVVTRLMYGGRVSLMVGFIVVLISIIIGVILGGLSGYFGGWVDAVIMRAVDIFNCIPSIPLYLIVGAVMEGNKVDTHARIYVLMFMMGALTWTGVARIVRGQILSLREQEFMIAAEATGLPVRRRIFRHLVPNVIPQLIVIATMNLGDVILAESTLSFLGLGVKYPLASWGNILYSVNDMHVMTNYLYCWIPAGFLILITVLGFNFVGDGLRDAFDPRMKR